MSSWTFARRHLQELVEEQNVNLIVIASHGRHRIQIGIEWYSGWTTIIIYPAGFAPKREVVDEFGLVDTVENEVIGEAWQRGPVILSWEDTDTADTLDVHNVVIHEFVHKLDMLNGAAHGFPPQHERSHARGLVRHIYRGLRGFSGASETGTEPLWRDRSRDLALGGRK